MFEVERIIRTALNEDIGAGDLTTEATVAGGTQGEARLVAKEDFVLAGIEVARQVFHCVDANVAFDAHKQDAQQVRKGEVLAVMRGNAASLLQAERVALNLVQRMCGVATLTAAFVDAVAGTGAQIVDTRKTTPGLRILEKYAVRMGGGRNHRYALYDGVLIKENHIAAAGGISAAVERARQRLSHIHKIEIETQTLDEVREALVAGADIILLDNMDVAMLREAVGVVAGRALTEASGGVNLKSVRGIAETGVDLISVGALTHSYRAVDISMLF
ncbi:nicotinate-nucleotide pyrophosphorylase [carboxylating] [Geoalkalibacter ferrihydriticus]|uniref:Probable nicotinate-nucleotide pyrophosphorylase [carboxylating] n=2 Tax=Geoalkalibacter ferrihydriticus TaxID=392333 RepID=A0A0C2HU92_9BACT|nr:carboxylating nicotinate-nucleotide diphosphorylase [Geoalkalibacter ferrihydriticus]KIH76407.1 nicotinate-nucleotide pyrophosphorylase [Geoalkalibacter ferrihydriticus DSM 17813]SDL92923.1 nicotinate-nucleotide pyrophosphorylase [carboxylating] [Geoalkalibacter ferrihydriticus]